MTVNERRLPKHGEGLKEDPPSLGGVRFWVERDVHKKPMDFCSIGDFLDNVLPHVGGSVAEIIKH